MLDGGPVRGVDRWFTGSELERAPPCDDVELRSDRLTSALAATAAGAKDDQLVALRAVNR